MLFPLHLNKYHALCMVVLCLYLSSVPDMQWPGLGQQHAAAAAQGGIPGGGGGGHDLGPSSGKGHGFHPQQNKKKMVHLHSFIRVKIQHIQILLDLNPWSYKNNFSLIFCFL
jgi:hypothetical protein